MKDFDCAPDGSEHVNETLYLLYWMCERFMKKHKRADVTNTDNRRVEFLVTNPENTKKILDVLTHFKLPLEEDGYKVRRVNSEITTNDWDNDYQVLYDNFEDAWYSVFHALPDFLTDEVIRS